MKAFTFATAATLSLLNARSAVAAAYSRTDNVVGSGFLDFFENQAIGDPTNGRVNYVDRATSLAQNLTYASGNTFVARADSKTVLSPSGAGRNSVRLRSKKQFTTHVAVFDVKHAPAGCGTWPAIWETNESNWPNGGEIDIYEGVNDVSPNAATLHTSAGCTMPAVRDMTGTVGSRPLDCDANKNGNAGCGVGISEANSYGPSFNSAGGGWYAVERTNAAIKVWFWSRSSATVPAAVRNGDASINTDSWGTPDALFPNTSCDIASKFNANNIIINLTFCGDWAGQAGLYNGAGCPGTCVDYVNNNPGAFTNAYFEFGSLNVYA